MANKKISELTLRAPTGVEMVPAEVSADTTPYYFTTQGMMNALVATETAKGAIELATTTEAKAGVDTSRAVTPAGLASYFAQTIEVGSSFKLNITGATRAEKFSQYSIESTFDGVEDPVFYWGWNVSGAGTRINAALPAVYQQFEADYYTGGVHYQEWNFNCYTTEQASAMRYLNFVCQTNNYRNAYWKFWIGDQGSSMFGVYERVSDVSYFRVITNGYAYLKQFLYFDNPANIGVNGGGTVTFLDAVKIVGNAGFYNTAPVAKQEVTGSRGSNAALASLLTALATMGLITDSSS